MTRICFEPVPFILDNIDLWPEDCENMSITSPFSRKKLCAIVFLLFFMISTTSSVCAQDPPTLSERVAADGLEVVMCSYFGGSDTEWATKLDFDSEGNVVITGETRSTDFPLENANQSTYGGFSDAFVVKFNTTGDIIFATYFGGNGNEDSMALIIDEEDNIIITGGTASSNLPLVNPLQDQRNGTTDAFIAKFSPSGDLLFSTYFGGSDEDRFERIGIDQYGNYVFTGYTSSDDYTTTPGVCQENYGGGTGDIVITALGSDCQSIQYSTHLGNSARELGLDVDFDSDGNIVLAGFSSISATNTTSGAYQQSYGGGTADSVIAKFSPNCTSLLWSTLLGGNGGEFCDDIDFDSSGNVIVSGYTGSTNFPLVNQFYNNTGNYDAFLAKFSPTGETLLFSTYLGGNAEDRSYGMEVLSDDTVVISSPAASTDMPTLNPFQLNNSGATDAYLALFDDEGLIYGSYFGGEGGDFIMGMTVHEENWIGLLGYTDSETLPTHNAIQDEFGGDEDAMIWILAPAVNNAAGIPIVPIVAIGIVGVVGLILVFVIHKKRSMVSLNQNQ